jgi:hypothetical protein
MLDTNHNNSNCKFTAETVSYIYGEIAAPEKIEFEAHLPFCSNCAEELAGFGLVRSSIFEWKDEFSTFKSPAFHLPTEKAQNSSDTTAISTRENSWLNSIRQLLSFTPARAVTVFAALVFCVGLTIVVFNFSGNSSISEIAETEFNKNVSPIISPTAEKQIIQPDESVNLKENSSDKSSEPQEQMIKKAKREVVEPDKATAPIVKEAVVKVSDNFRKTTIGNKSSVIPNASSGKDNRKENRKPIPAQAQKVPTLVDAEETEDDSIRLADLFDEVETR